MKIVVAATVRHSGEHAVAIFCIVRRPELTLFYSWASGEASLPNIRKSFFTN